MIQRVKPVWPELDAGAHFPNLVRRFEDDAAVVPPRQPLCAGQPANPAARDKETRQSGQTGKNDGPDRAHQSE